MGSLAWLKAFLLAIFFAADFRDCPSLIVLSKDARLKTSSIPTRIRHLSPLKIAQLGALVKERASISTVASHYIDIPVGGKSVKKAVLCPFHDDKNPSMFLSDDKGLFHCFSCKASGDIITFVQDIEKIPFIEALKKVATLAGIGDEDFDFEDEKMSPAELQRFQQRQRILQVLERASAYYVQNLMADPKAGPVRGYLMMRGVTPATAFAFKLGFAPSTAALFLSLAKEGFTPEELVLAGLCINSTESTSNTFRKDHLSNKKVYQSSNNPKLFDRFRNRLMIPIRKADGQVVGFGGRALDESAVNQPSLKYNPKYLNSPETMVFKKNSLLFGYDLARAYIKESGTAIVVEGYFDVMALYSAGVKNVVATMGTVISAEQLLSLADRSNPRVTSIVLLMDADEAGIESVRRTCLQVLNKLPDDINVKIGSFNFDNGTSIPVKDSGDMCSYFSELYSDRDENEISCEDEIERIMHSIVNRAPGWRDWLLDDVLTKAIGKNISSASDQYKALVVAVDYIKSLSTTPAYRTLLAFNCASRISGENVVLRNRLESEILEMLDKSSINPVTVSRKSGIDFTDKNDKFSQPIYPKPPDSRQNSNPTPPFTRASVPFDASNMKFGEKNKETKLWDQPLTIVPRQYLYGPDASFESQVVDVESLFSSGFEVQIDSSFNRKKLKGRNKSSNDFESILNVYYDESDEIFTGDGDLTNSVNISTSLQSLELRRVGDAETIILLTYIHFPVYRSAVCDIVQKIERLSSAWTDPVRWSIWNEISSNSAGNFSESGSSRVMFFKNLNAQLLNRTLVDTEVILRTAEKTLMEWHSKKSQMNLINSMSDLLHPLVSRENTNVSFKFEEDKISELSKYEEDLSTFSEEAAKLKVLLWESLDGFLQSNDTSPPNRFTLDEEDISKNTYDIESEAAEAFLNFNSDPNEYMIQEIQEREESTQGQIDDVITDRYDFNFLDENMILSEQEAKLEDERLKDIQKANTEARSSDEKPLGYTIGIDDIYDDSYVYKNPKTGKFQEGSYRRARGNSIGQRRSGSSGSKNTKEENFATPEILEKRRNYISSGKDNTKSEWFGTYQHKFKNSNNYSKQRAVNDVGPPGQPKPPPKRPEPGKEIQGGGGWRDIGGYLVKWDDDDIIV